MREKFNDESIHRSRSFLAVKKNLNLSVNRLCYSLYDFTANFSSHARLIILRKKSTPSSRVVKMKNISSSVISCFKFWCDSRVRWAFGPTLLSFVYFFSCWIIHLFCGRVWFCDCDKDLSWNDGELDSCRRDKSSSIWDVEEKQKERKRERERERGRESHYEPRGWGVCLGICPTFGSLPLLQTPLFLPRWELREKARGDGTTVRAAGKIYQEKG